MDPTQAVIWIFLGIFVLTAELFSQPPRSSSWRVVMASAVLLAASRGVPTMNTLRSCFGLGASGLEGSCACNEAARSSTASKRRIMAIRPRPMNQL